MERAIELAGDGAGVAFDAHRDRQAGLATQCLQIAEGREVPVAQYGGEIRARLKFRQDVRRQQDGRADATSTRE